MASSTGRRWSLSVLCAIALAGCVRARDEGEPATPEHASAGASKPRGGKSDHAAPQTSKDEDAARGRTPRRAPRDAETITDEIDGLERLLAASPASAGDRPQLIRRIADRYLELEAALKEQRKSPQAERAAKKARQNAIERYEQVVKEHPTYGAMDEVLYDLARAYEEAGELDPARRHYADLIERFPSSPLVPRAFYGLGVILREQGRSDPAKKKLAQDAFEKAARTSKPGDPIHRLAVAENGGVEPGPIAQAPAPVAATPSASASTSASAAPATPAPPPAAKLGIDGTYVAEGGNYRLEAKFEAGKIIVTEPNKVSVYEQQGDSRVHRYFDRALNTEYLLEVAPDGKALFAFKPNTPNNRTRLTLLGPAKSGDCKAGLLEIPVKNDAALNPNNERLWGTRERNPVDATGVYKTDGTNPIVDLRPDGSGVFEMHGAPKPEYVYNVKWWLQTNCDGTLINTTHPAATVYWIVIDFGDKPYQGLRYKRYGLQVRSDRMVILDRVKSR